MLTVDSLRAFGADVNDGLGRCLNNEAFYLKLVKKAIDSDGYEKLAAAVAAGDTKAGFEAAHMLKGILANLAITPILTPASELCEMLRSGTPGDYDAYVKLILEKRDELKAMM